MRANAIDNAQRPFCFVVAVWRRGILFFRKACANHALARKRNTCAGNCRFSSGQTVERNKIGRAKRCAATGIRFRRGGQHRCGPSVGPQRVQSRCNRWIRRLAALFIGLRVLVSTKIVQFIQAPLVVDAFDIGHRKRKARDDHESRARWVCAFGLIQLHRFVFARLGQQRANIAAPVGIYFLGRAYGHERLGGDGARLGNSGGSMRRNGEPQRDEWTQGTKKPKRRAVGHGNIG